MGPGQTLVPWLGVVLGWQCWSEHRVEVREVFLQVPAVAVPCLTHRAVPHGVTTTDHTSAWDLKLCGDLREGWVLLALLAVPSRPP